jgi:isopenicillin N synthase-like dioxygenase
LDLTDELFVQSERFFRLPEGERNKIHIANSPYFRGYHPPNTLGPDAPKTKIANMLDSFNLATDLPSTDPYVKAGIPYASGEYHDRYD